jgi:hypothetical protein
MTPPEATSSAFAAKGPDILQLRLESATWNLENLAGVLRHIQARADAVRELQKQLSEDRNQISETLATLESYLKRLGELASAENPKSGPLRREVENAVEEFQALQTHIADARLRATSIFSLQLDPISLNQSEKEFTAKIESSRVQVGELNLAASENGAASWTRLKDLGSVWVEYLDYLGGLCLRYEGLDSAICEIGDALIQELKRSAGELAALAVPGRESAAPVRRISCSACAAGPIST